MSAAGSFRAFFALPLGEPTGRALEAAARGLVASARGPGDGWRVTPAGRIHVTLKFLGDAPREVVPLLEAALREAAAEASPFPMEFGGWHLLPGPRDPRVLAVGVSDPTGTLRALAAMLEERSAALGFPREGRPFLAHVTVARRKPGRGRRGVRGGPVHHPSSTVGTGGAPPAAGAPVAVEEARRIVLMESTLGPDGPAYAVVAEAGLSRGTADRPPA